MVLLRRDSPVSDVVAIAYMNMVSLLEVDSRSAGTGKAVRGNGRHVTVRAKALATHGRALLVGDVEGTLHLWDAGGGEEEGAMAELWVVEGAHRDAVQALALSERAAFSVSYDQLIKVWEVRWKGKRVTAGKGEGEGDLRLRSSVWLLQHVDQKLHTTVCFYRTVITVAYFARMKRYKAGVFFHDLFQICTV